MISAQSESRETVSTRYRVRAKWIHALQRLGSASVASIGRLKQERQVVRGPTPIWITNANY
jgi:hypothetical protein